MLLQVLGRVIGASGPSCCAIAAAGPSCCSSRAMLLPPPGAAATAAGRCGCRLRALLLLPPGGVAAPGQSPPGHAPAASGSLPFASMCRSRSQLASADASFQLPSSFPSRPDVHAPGIHKRKVPVLGKYFCLLGQVTENGLRYWYPFVQLQAGTVPGTGTRVIRAGVSEI
jgi:hypothetical protein